MASERLKYLLIFPSFAFLIFFTLLPLLYTFYLSFTSTRIAEGSVQQFLTLSNYGRIFQDDLFIHSLKVTLIFVSAGVFLEFIFGLGLALVAHAITRFRYLFSSVMAVPVILPYVSVGMIWRLLLNTQFGLVNSILRLIGFSKMTWLQDMNLAFVSLLLCEVWHWTPFVFLILFAGIEALPKEPFQAAIVDGASRWQMFRYLTLPLLKPIIVVALLFRTMAAFRAFDAIYVLTHGGPGNATQVTSLYIHKLAFQIFDLGYAATGGLFLALVVVLFSLFYLRLQRT